MPEYVRLWNTENTVIKVNIERQRETLVIERTRGKKNKRKKTCRLEIEQLQRADPGGARSG